MHSRNLALQALGDKEAALRRAEKTAQREKEAFNLVMAFVREHPEALRLRRQEAFAMFLKFNPDLHPEQGSEISGAFDGPMFGD
jgi:hypothetical protein